MDDTPRTIIDKITVNLKTPKKLAPGKECSVFYDCIRLSPADLARLAVEAVGHLDFDDFDLTVGIAYSGILFAAAVAGGKLVAIVQHDHQIYGPELKGKRVILVDDVVHTGSRMLQAEKLVLQAGASIIGYACIVDRSSAKFGTSTKPLWSAYQTEML